jgi:putative ABC transport system permease protein
VTGGWRLAARNLRRNRRRNLATGLAIALGFGGLAILGGYIDRVELFLRTNAVYLQHGGHVVIYREGGLDRAAARPAKYSLNVEDRQSIGAALEGDRRVQFSASYLKGMGLAGNGCRTVPFVALGIEPGVLERVTRHPDVVFISADFVRPLRGRPLFEYDGVDGAVGLAAGLARLLGKTRIHDDFGARPPDIVVPDCAQPEVAARQIASDANIQLAGLSFDGAIAAIDGEVVNVFHTPSAETEDQTIQTSLATLQKLYATDAVTYVAVFLRNVRDTEALAGDLRRRLDERGVPADVYTYLDSRVNPYYVGSMGFLRSMATFIVILVAAVVALGILNAGTLTVFERSREIGTFRALGYTRRHVVGLFVREAVLLTVAGMALGLVLGHTAALLVQALNIRVTPPGVPGSLRLDLTPGPLVYLAITAMLLPLSLLVTWIVVRRRVRERASDLLTATTA